MEEIKEFLHLDVMTVTGKTLEENLKDLQLNGFYENCHKYLPALGVKVGDIIKPIHTPIKAQGAIAILKGNLAPEGAVVKHSAISPRLMQVTLKARVFDCEETAIEAVLQKKIHPGEAVFIRYEGPKGSGMPEMFYTTEAIAFVFVLVVFFFLFPRSGVGRDLLIDHRRSFLRSDPRPGDRTCIPGGCRGGTNRLG